MQQGRQHDLSHLLSCPLTIPCRQDTLVLHLYLLPYHHQGRFLGSCAQLELHLQPAKLPFHIFDPRVIVGDAPTK